MLKKKILVTGGAGFIGTNIVHKLLDLNYEVVVLDNLSSGYLCNLDSVKNKDNFKFVKGDIRDKELVSKLIVGCYGVIHLAAMISVPESIENPSLCKEINEAASEFIIEECLKNNSRFLFASSAAVYGEDKTPIKTEELLVKPISPYGDSKLFVENKCKSLIEKGLNFCCFRNFNVYGPYQALGSAYAAVIPIFVNKALHDEEIIIFGDGKQTRDFIFVEDVVDAFINALESKEGYNDVFNLGCNEIITITELAVKIIELTNSSSKIIYKDARLGDIKHSRATSAKFQKASSWKPKVSFDEGIKKTIDYYKEN